jgi:hypothetical protein
MLSRKVKARIRYNKVKRLHRLYPERLPKIFIYSERGPTSPVTYTNAYHIQAMRVERNEEIWAIMQLPKAIDYPGLRGRPSWENHPLNFGRPAWKPELKMLLWENGRPSWSSSGTRELKVVPRHHHHHWPDWAYEIPFDGLTPIRVSSEGVYFPALNKERNT